VGTPEEIYEHPANPFVYHFLGKVNLFHGRVHGGRVQIGSVELDAPEHAEVKDAPAVGYARSHEIELDRIPGDPATIEAVVSSVHAVGSVVRLELMRQDGGGCIEAELPRERYNELKFQKGERVFVKLRNLKVFLKNKETDPPPQVYPSDWVI